MNLIVLGIWWSYKAKGVPASSVAEIEKSLTRFPNNVIV